MSVTVLQGDCRDVLDNKGRFVKGHRASPATEFKCGEHWRPHQQFREKEWLVGEYVEKQRSAAEIASQFSVTPGAIAFWLNKHGVKARTTAEARSVKHWGSYGEKNPMHGRVAEANPNW